MKTIHIDLDSIRSIVAEQEVTALNLTLGGQIWNIRTITLDELRLLEAAYDKPLPGEKAALAEVLTARVALLATFASAASTLPDGTAVAVAVVDPSQLSEGDQYELALSITAFYHSFLAHRSVRARQHAANQMRQQLAA